MTAPTSAPPQGRHTQHPLSTTSTLQPLSKQHLLTEISQILPSLAGRVLVPTVRGSGTSALCLCCSHSVPTMNHRVTDVWPPGLWGSSAVPVKLCRISGLKHKFPHFSPLLKISISQRCSPKKDCFAPGLSRHGINNAAAFPFPFGFCVLLFLFLLIFKLFFTHSSQTLRNSGRSFMPQENAETSREIAWIVLKLSNFVGLGQTGDDSWCPSDVSGCISICSKETAGIRELIKSCQPAPSIS